MKITNTIKYIAYYSAMTGATASFSHEVHGASAWHWHMTDVAGWVTLAAFAGLAIWLTRNGKK
jgi:hypothetical protein